MSLARSFQIISEISCKGIKKKKNSEEKQGNSLFYKYVQFLQEESRIALNTILKC